jgi:hypothetical protein
MSEPMVSRRLPPQAAMASSIAASSSQAPSLFGAVSEDKTRLLIGWLV